jgi:sugar lactone lactonase YvrE
MNKSFFTNRACLVLALVMSLGFWNSATAQSFPETISLPDGYQPEGITLGNGPTAYVGSLASGSIYEIDLRTGASSMLVEGYPGSLLAVGLDFDKRSGNLFVAGGLTGDGRVYDTTTGDMVAQISLSTAMESWINDVVVTRDAAYFTNSFYPYIYKVWLTPEGLPSGVVQTLELHGDFVNVTNPDATNPFEMVINANGIVATPDNRTLIVVNYFLGTLYTVDPDTGHATEIDLGGLSVPVGDGLVLRGKTLYVVQNPNQISVFKLSPDYSAATLTNVLTDPSLRTPSTADLFGPWLYVVNARFDKCFPGPCPDDEFEIVRVDQ